MPMHPHTEPEPHLAAAPQPRTATRKLPPARILLVDDEPKNLLALDAVLAEEGRDLVSATSGAEALKHLLHDDFAVILLDVNMPDMDGFETAALVRGRERTRDTPIIFLTAAIKGETHVARGYSLGAVDYIFKPFDPDVLRSKVSVFVELFRKTQQVRQQAEQLAETTEFLNSVLESATAYAILAMDLHGYIEAWNEGAVRMFGYAPSEMVGRRRLRALYDAATTSGARVQSFREQCVHEPKAEGVFELVRRGGERFTASVVVNHRTDLGGVPIGYVAIIQDITERLEAERERTRLIEEQAARAEAETARRRFALLAEATTVASRELDVDRAAQSLADFAVPRLADLCSVDLVDEHGSVRCVAAAGAARGADAADRLRALAAERRSDDALGMVLTRGVPRVFRDLAEAQIAELDSRPERQQALRELHPTSALLVPLRSRGHILGALLLLTAEGSGRRFIEDDLALVEDLADRAALALDNARLYGEAQQAVRVRDEFLSSASHDLKTPLTVIKGQTQILARRVARWEVPDAPRAIEMLRRVDQASARMMSMVEQVLDVAQLQAGRPLQLNRQPTDIVTLARDLVRDLGPQDHHVIRVQSTESSLVGDWDPQRIERVLGNLVNNALKYSPEGGEVDVTLSRVADDAGAWAVLLVQDHGVGIPEDELARVFDRFYRGRNVVGKIYGTGIGLAGVQHIVEQHGGRVAVTSTEGEGTMVTVTLPLAPPLEAAVTEPATAEAG